MFENERYNPAIIEGRGSQKLQYSEYGEHLYTPCDVNVYLKLIDFVHNIVIICGFLESPFYNQFLATLLSILHHHKVYRYMFLYMCGYSTVCVCMIQAK